MLVRHALLVTVAASTLAACASSTQGSGTGAGPRDGATLPDVSSGAASTPASSAPSSDAAVPSSDAASAPSSGSGATSTLHPVPSAPVRTVVAKAPDGTEYKIEIWAENAVRDCAAHAYGAIVAFLKQHPCYGMRQVLATTEVDGRQVGFAQRSIGFRGGMNESYRAAGRFRQLVTQSGTGNLNDLMREGYRLPSGPSEVPFPNAFSALGQDNSVTIVEAWYLDGTTPDNDPPLVRMARDIFLQV